MNNNKKDGWDKADTILKGITTILVPLAIWYLAYRGDNVIQKMQNSESKLKLRTELLSRRESAESDLRKDMFTSIIKSFVYPQEKSPTIEEELLNLELLAYNFHESLYLKPLFLHLRKKITIQKEEKSLNDIADDLNNRLEKVARKISEVQTHILEQVGSKLDGTMLLPAWEGEDQSKRPVFINKGELTLNNIKRSFELNGLEFDFKNNEVKIRLAITEIPSGQMEIFEFWVGYFDFPSIDNIRLSENQRCSVVLKKLDKNQKSAEITLLYFPGSYASLKDKPYIEDMIRNLGLESKSEGQTHKSAY